MCEALSLPLVTGDHVWVLARSETTCKPSSSCILLDHLSPECSRTRRGLPMIAEIYQCKEKPLSRDQLESEPFALDLINVP